MEEEKIKEAFSKAKQDILNLNIQLELIKQEIKEIKLLIFQQTVQQTDAPAHSPAENQTQKYQNTTIQQINPTKNTIPTDIPAHNLSFKAFKTINSRVSIGNEGVPADRQTDRQTNNSTGNQGVKVRLNKEKQTKNEKIEHLQKVSDLFNSLDIIKKELRIKLKKLTKQEMTVFATTYQLEEEGFIVDYHLIAQKLSLTESSIRDYIQRILKKGLPIQKTKENNKKIILLISPELKKIASLSTILQLREL